MILRLALALLGLLPAVLGLVVAAWLGRRAQGGGWSRAAAAAIPATLGLMGVLLGLRALDYLGGGAGLAAWFQTAGAPTAAKLSMTVLKLQLVASGVFALGLVSWTLIAPGSPSSNQKLNRLLGLIGGLCALVSTGIVAAAPLACEPVLELAALAPLLGLGLGLSGLSQRAVSEPPPSIIAPPAPPPPVDAEAVLLRAGLLKTEPAFTFPATGAARAEAATGAKRPALETLWAASGGAGPPPAVLEQVQQALKPGSGAAPGQWLGDLPPETLNAITSSVVLDALAGYGGRVLVVSAEPGAVAAAVERALARIGLSRVGAVAIGTGTVKEQLTAGLFPALVCLDVHELAGEVQKHLARGNPLWLPLLDLILLHRVDELPPIESTHLALALRRLALLAGTQLGEGRGQRWLALGTGGGTVRRYVEQAVARSFDELELGAKETAAARVFLRRLPQRTGPGAHEELQEWGRTLRSAGATVDLEDPSGELAEAARALSLDPQRLHRSAGYHGATSLALCDERQLAQLYRTGSRLLHRVPSAQRSVVWLKDGPLTRFLSQSGTLAGLAGRGELPTPRPLAGTDNPFLAAAHLEAALDEGQPDEAQLRHAFSDAAVDALLAASPDVKRVGVRARWDGDKRRVSRSALLSRPGAPVPEQRQQTITLNVVDVRSKHDGALLGRVDRRIASTRYYPHRVFAHQGRLYQVLAGQAPGAGAISVGPAAAGSLPTTPLLDLRVESTGYHAPPERHRFASLSFARAVAGIRVHESIRGAVPRGGADPAVTYEPIEARYDSTAAVVLFERVPGEAALFHLARAVDLLLPAHLTVEDEDIEVLSLPAGLGELGRPALVFVDRHLGGIGVAAAIDAATAHNLLRWAWGALYSCPCMNGCEKCTPPLVLKRGADKQGVLKLLGG